MKTLRNLLILLALLFSTASFASTVTWIAYPTTSDNGAWFDPETNGSGIQLNVWKGDTYEYDSALTWYTYDYTGKQLWFLGVQEFVDAGKGATYTLYHPKGFGFLSEKHALGEPIGSAVLNRWVVIDTFGEPPITWVDIVDSGFIFSWQIDFGPNGCEGFSPRPEWCTGSYRLRKLTPE